MARPFTPKQETLLNAIVPGVQSGTIGADWIVSYSNEYTTIFDNVHHRDTNFHTLGWSKATRADFATFVKHGIFIQETKSNYSLDEAALMNGYRLGFDYPEPQAASQTFNFQGAKIGIANINTVLNNSTQTVQNSAGLEQDFKQGLEALIKQLQEALNEVPPEHEKAAVSVAKQADRLVEDLSDDEKERATVSLEGLKKAAQNLLAVTPAVLAIATQIATHVAPLLVR